MCGISGFYLRSAPDDAAARLQRMTSAIAHRGPDDAGLWTDLDAGVGLGHRRLSIIDLSAAGHQPMHSASRRYTIVFNGEIYNFTALRAELETAGYRFNGRSDTEVMLAAFEHWGVASAVGRLRGMFAFAAWDSRDRCLYLARDALGKKPLYLGEVDGGYVFGSELRAVWGWSGAPGELEPAAVRSLLEFGHVRAPLAITRGVQKILPGEICRLEAGAARVGVVARQRFWSARSLARTSTPAGAADYEDIVRSFENVLTEAVRLRMIADVPLGMFLSGGIDSCLVAAMMQAEASAPVRAFTVGFDEPEFDESPAAVAVARHLGLRHQVITVAEADLLAIVPQLPDIYDEPFADASQIPTVLLCRAASTEVKVAVSGDGGDESFAGYNRYLVGRRLQRLAGLMPAAARRGLAHSLARLPAERLARVATVLAGRNVTADQLQKLFRVAGSESLASLYDSLLRAWPQAPMRGELPGQTGLPAVGDVAEMMLADLEGYLPDDVLVKVDRASMACGLEVRSPLLDLRLVELAAVQPLAVHLDRSGGKRLLRSILQRHVPRELWDRPKAGFTPPVGTWLRTSLRDWAEDLLQPVIAGHDPWLDPVAIDDVWRRHLSGREDAQGRLWPVLMFLAWRRAVGA